MPPAPAALMITALLGTSAWASPSDPGPYDPAPIAADEHARTIEAMKPPKRERPLIAVVALLSFRTVRGTLLPLTSIGLSVVWTLGAMVAIDPMLNLVTVSVPMLLLVIGFAYAVHIVSCYYGAIEAGRSWDASAATRGLYEVLLPTFLTSLTTVAGFFSLVTNPLSAVREFGLYGGIGVGFAAAVNLVVHAVDEARTGVFASTVSISRVTGAALGGQIAAAVIIGAGMTQQGLPAENGFTGAFALGLVAALAALLATTTIPRRSVDPSTRALLSRTQRARALP